MKPSASGSLLLLGLALLAGCAPMNVSRAQHRAGEPLYQPSEFTPDPANSDELFVALALSGGGTRAASLSYGVFELLRETDVVVGGHHRDLLSEVDLFSSVSGSSFPAAYYTLFGDRLFSDFKQRFLLRDIEKALALRVFLPPTAFRHFSPYYDRIDAAADLYDRELFEQATFRDLALKRRKPLLVLNATNMSLGVPFDFTETQFENIGSDLSQFPIGRAVAASSAFPFLLSPVTLKNFGNPREPQWVTDGIEGGLTLNRELYLRAMAWRQMSDSLKHPYVHLLDGGLADNIGAQYIDRSMSASDGWIRGLLQGGRVRQLLVFTVNAQTEPDTRMDLNRRGPGLVDVLFRTSSVAMDAMTNTSIEQLTQRFREYRALSTQHGASGGEAPGTAECREEREVCNVCYFPMPAGEQLLEMFIVNVDLDQLSDAGLRKEVEAVPTSFKLSAEQVNLMILSGRRLVKDSPCFQAFLRRRAAAASEH
jgi:NTE family protein